ncbi:tetratricopeptide repeat protein [Mangrovibacterium marinum]|uniref:Tetratricopeptide repeat protein n=1 Tax=Mangrovibacterium marinum TaxID=1639118 RepID=A0A2T5C6L3_9BACT|nr:tetratricopeptide repeat protein [Mangrovibacterium marinum]PTN10589.1 tetratricopeptide repeat protein [Mangrovibacterium marinum]
MKTNLSHKFLLLFLLVILGGCSTEKNTAVTRTYHNVTSRYNIYFNGKESLKAGLERIDQSVDDDFTRILPVYKASMTGAERLASAEMDNAILKASKLIKIHSLTKKPKRRRIRSAAYKNLASKDEYNNWVDDSYLLMGKAYFYQKKFPQAMENFNYVIRKYSQEPSRFEALIWLLRCYSEQERYSEAMEVIKDIDASLDFPKKLDQEFSLAVADFHLKQKEYEETIPALKAVLRKPANRADKARYSYILAQLYKETGNNQLAIETFRKAAKLSPSYMMAFNARINAAGVFTENENLDKLVLELNKMLKDEKNHEFRDQIYYALANIDKRRENKTAAIENYRLSSATSISNDYQKALSCLTLADIYFTDQIYKEARAYYDSAMMVIDNSYPNYAFIADRHKSLVLLTNNLLTVEREDSLQALALMSEADRNRKIDSWIKAERDAEMARKQQEAQERMDRNFYRMNQARGSLSQQQSSGWYFYNSSTITLGKIEFEQEWGKRKLEDNWRRKNKNQFSEIEQDELAEETAKDSTKVEEPRENDKLKRAYYLQDLPLTDAQMRASNIRIRDALFNAGRIFKQDYENYPMAIDEYEDLLQRYDENIYKLTTYFELWDLYAKIGNRSKSDYYKQLIVNGYPNSKYAQYLVNPNYFIELEAHRDSINRLYQQAFSLYKQGDYNQAGQYASKLQTMDADTILLAKAAFIETIAKGEKGSFEQFGTYLDQYMANYPASPAKPMAERIRQLIQDSTLVDYQKLVASGYLNDKIVNDELLAEKNQVQDEFNGKFSYDEELLHYFVIAFNRTAQVDINRLKFDIANYNIDHYMKTDFDLEVEPLNAQTSLLSVRTIPNKEQALIYFRSIIRKPEVYATLRGVDYVNFVVSTYNYRELKADHNTEDYLKFFLKNYSRFIGGDFPEGELPEPEELMAKAMEEDQKLEERGTFVMVTPEVKTELYSRTADAPHSFAIAIQDRDFKLKGMLDQFARFNKEEFGSLRLSTDAKVFGDYQLLVVSPLSNAEQAMSYFRRVITNRSLFDELGDRSYRNFIISNTNLQTLTGSHDVNEYMNFFREYYISGEALKSPQNTPNQSSETTTKPAEKNAPAVTPSLFRASMNSEHSFVLLLPAQTVDQEKLLDDIEAHNDQFDPEGKLRIELQPYNDQQVMVRVFPFADSDRAMNYLQNLVRDQQVYGPLGELEYRNFVISEANIDLLLERKNLSDYMKFYKENYLSR